MLNFAEISIDLKPCQLGGVFNCGFDFAQPPGFGFDFAQPKEFW